GGGGLAGPAGLFGFGEGYGRDGDYWAFRALGAGVNTSENRPMTPRPHLTRGRPTPAAEDPSALGATGDDPTVLAFALGSQAGRVASGSCSPRPGPDAEPTGPPWTWTTAPGTGPAATRSTRRPWLPVVHLHPGSLRPALVPRPARPR